jgi:hypothetical protein
LVVVSADFMASGVIYFFFYLISKNYLFEHTPLVETTCFKT